MLATRGAVFLLVVHAGTSNSYGPGGIGFTCSVLVHTTTDKHQLGGIQELLREQVQQAVAYIRACFLVIEPTDRRSVCCKGYATECARQKQPQGQPSKHEQYRGPGIPAVTKQFATHRQHADRGIGGGEKQYTIQ